VIRAGLIVALALPLMGAACQSTIETPDTRGAGFSAGTPNPGTRNYIVQNDQPFAVWLAGHNRACAKAPACVK
jgi:hypothetical protein